MKQKYDRSQALKLIFNILLVIVGNTIYALGVTLFILPNSLITGGTTGIALVFNHLFNVPITTFVSVFNVATFILGAVILGKKFALTTLISTFYYPVALGVSQKLFADFKPVEDKLLATVYAGLMIGISIGIVIRAGASTGGMDIPPLVLNKLFGIPVSGSMYAFDFTILISQMIFSDRDRVLYGILLVMIYTLVIDKVLLSGQSKTQVKIVSEKYREINEKIILELDRGSTLINSRTGYKNNETTMVLTVISNRELNRLNRIVTDIDPHAFMIVSRVNEVKGRGFTLSKKYI